jgi:hypothetical protein
MQRTMSLVLGLLLIVGMIGTAAAQSESGVTNPPKVLVISREFVKPGRTGASHEKTESAFVQAMMKADWPVHYVAMDSLSGKSRSLFLTGYDSLGAWGNDMRATEKNAALTSALDQAAFADGNLLDAMDQSVFTFNEEMSLRPAVDIAHMRYMEIELFHVRPGHSQEWNEAVKLVKAAYEKSVPDAHWAMYRMLYGGSGGTFVVFTPMKSLAETDQMMGNQGKFAAAMGEDGMKKLLELEAATVESSERNLFVFDPKMSYAPPEWIEADPEFWKPKMMTASAGASKKGPSGKQAAAKSSTGQ